MKQKQRLVIILMIVLATVCTLLSYHYISHRATQDQAIIDEKTTNEKQSNMYQEIISTSFCRYYQLKREENPNLVPYELFLEKQDFDQVEDKEIAKAINDIIYQSLITSDEQYGNIKYYVKDHKSGKYITNANTDVEILDNILTGNAYPQSMWYLAFSIDDKGIYSLKATNDNHFQANLTSSYLEQAAFMPFAFIESDISIKSEDGSVHTIIIDGSALQITNFVKMQDVSFVFMMDNETMNALFMQNSNHIYSYVSTYYDHTQRIYLLCMIGIIAFIMIYRNDENNMPLFSLFKKIPMEVHIILLLVSLSWAAEVGGHMVIHTMEQMTSEPIMNVLDIIVLWVLENGVIWFLLYAYIAYVALVFKDLIKRKAWKEYSFSYRCFHWLKKQCHTVFTYIKHIDLTNNDDKRLLTALTINFIIVFLCSFIPIFSFFLLLIYTIVLYIIMKKYITSIRHDYDRLLAVTKHMANGQLDIDIDVDLGVFQVFSDNLEHINEGFQRAVDEEVHSQRMKAELITNVSHDLKTPLTNMITYVDLLKKEDISEEERKKYMEVLDRNSHRLKRLIDDLFEMSKANSGTMKLDRMDVDIVALMRQVQVECENQIKQKKLHFKNTHSDDKIICQLDSMRTYRIFENLVINITKYAMKNTRVFIDISDYGSYVDITMRNISATEMNFNPEEIMERFTRGDASRNSEGSGLGLAIAKSFTELQGGTLHITIDGDLFKVNIRFPK